MKCDPAECSDGELAALAVAGREDAFAELIRRHRDAIYRLIRGYTGNSEDAVDLLQEALISAYKALDVYDGARPFRAWLSRIAINKCRDWSRRRAVRRFLFMTGPSAEAEQVPDPLPGADETAAGREELERLWEEIARLPRNLKEPLILRTIEGLTQAETAGVLGISEKAVETRLYRARQKLAIIRQGIGGGGA
jgi:RNA polymerase sigma factor CnrH